jgi:hypothetical protein
VTLRFKAREGANEVDRYQITPYVNLLGRSSKTKERHVVAPANGHRMPNPVSVHSNQMVAPCVRRVPALRSVRLGGVRLGVVVPKDATPLLDGLVVVVRQQRRVGRAMVDLHPWARACVHGVHVCHHLFWTPY